MKKYKKYTSFIGIIMLVFVFFISFYMPHASAGEVWYFKDLTAGKKYGPYTSQSDCQKALDGMTFSGKLITAGSTCLQQTSDSVNSNAADNSLPFNAVPDNSVPIGPDTGGSNLNNNTYTLLAPLPGLKSIQTNDIGHYLNIIFQIAIGLAGALAVIMIVIGGVQYMGDESVFGKTEAKSKMLSAILGLFIALGAWAILNTIDPALTGANGVSIDQVTANLEGDAQAPVTINGASAQSIGIMCPDSGGVAQIPSIARSFAGKMTYSQQYPKGQIESNNTIYLDCSGFVNYVIGCAGINHNNINGGTGKIFSGAEKVDTNTFTDTSINGKALQVGDLIGWRPQDDKNGNGHVMIYIGNGMVNDSNGGGGKHPVGQALGTFVATKYKSAITYIKRISTL